VKEALLRLPGAALEPDELTTIRRTALVVKVLCDGYGLTTHQVAEMTGLTMQGARYMLKNIESEIGAHREDGVWQL
jgi:hypothetical protein